ncbi:DUF7827 domain-containing protein [Natrinema altunense]|uniref:DUF7827 domain-containing protein n=1 Tax=Natrinema altunense TaxID=222984 RepID=A0A482XUS2_9EURY|nr:hypothetical protein [Natrinema altunense]RZH67048.1 hypothetical protein ELS17_14850 [Natrinema altunense]
MGAGSGTEADTGAEIGPQPINETVEFADSNVAEQRGNVATIQLELTNTDETSLLVRSAQRDFRADLRVRDEDGDGTVRVRFNTFYGVEHGNRPAFTAVGDDSVTVRTHATTQSLPMLEAGRYNMIASTETSRIAGVLQLEEPTVGESQSRAIAPGTDVKTVAASEVDIQATAGKTTIAKGDIGRAEFDVSGVEGLLQDPTARDQLVTATDSRPRAQTTHRVQQTPDRNIEGVETISIDYDESGGVAPNIQSLSWNDLEILGVDTDDDGHIDRSLTGSVSGVRTTSAGEISIRFDEPVSISESETFFAAYTATNPGKTGTADVRVRFGSDQYVETGEISYGADSLGTLTHGVDLRLQSADDRSRIGAPLGSLTTTYNSTTDTLVADVDTTHLEPGTYTVRFQIYDDSPVSDDGSVVTERFVVVPQSASISEPTLTNESTLVVNATTNLAPENDVAMRVQTDPLRKGYLLECTTTVERDGSVACEYELPDTESPLNVTIRRGGTQLAEPVQYELPDATERYSSN